jgi:hypothetical protein
MAKGVEMRENGKTTVKPGQTAPDQPSQAKVKNGRFLGVPLTTPKQIERSTFSARRARSAANAKS